MAPERRHVLVLIVDRAQIPTWPDDMLDGWPARSKDASDWRLSAPDLPEAYLTVLTGRDGGLDDFEPEEVAEIKKMVDRPRTYAVWGRGRELAARALLDTCPSPDHALIDNNFGCRMRIAEWRRLRDEDWPFKQAK
jgi:hypothetical protein